MLPILIAASLAAGPVIAVSSGIPKLDPGEGRAVALDLAGKLERDYSIAAIGARYARDLRVHARSGRYDHGNWKDLVDEINDDLQTTQPDGHLRLYAGPPPTSNDDAPAGGGSTPMPVEAGQWLAPGIAYVRFRQFPGSAASIAATRDFMATHATARTLILDVRDHHGGGLAEMDVIFPYLYARRTALVDMQVAARAERENGRFFPDAPSITLRPSPADVIVRRHSAIPGVAATALRRATVILLISRKTASAGEHFALALRRTYRATLIGERTAGANHFGGIVPVDRHFSVFLPIGRTFDPVTGADWEGAGVQPDVAVDPALALTDALERSGFDAARARAVAARVER